MDRAAADAAPAEDADREVLGRAPAAVLEEQRQHVVLALIEVGGAVVAALLERDHLQAGAGELAHRDRAAGAGADDDGVDVERDVGAEVAAAHDGSWPRARPAGRRSRCTRHVRASR